MEDMTQPDTSKYNNYTAPDGTRYKREGENWVPQEPGMVEDVAKGARAGLGTGTWKALTAPAGIVDMGLAGAQYIAGDTPFGGDIGRLRENYVYPATYEGSAHLLHSAFPSTTYEPQTTLGNIAKTTGDIAPTAALGVLGEGMAGARYLPAAARAALSTAGGGIGGGITHDNAPMLESPAEATGMLTGMSGPAMVRSLLKPPKGGIIEKAKEFGGAIIPTALGGAASAYLGPKFGHNALASALEGGVLGYLGGGPAMKAGGELAGAVGKAMVPKAVSKGVTDMTKALSKKNLYNTKYIDPVTASAVLAGQVPPVVQTVAPP